MSPRDRPTTWEERARGLYNSHSPATHQPLRRHSKLPCTFDGAQLIRDLLDDIDNYSSEPDRFLDVPFVPSDEAVVEAMLALAKVGPEDVVYYQRRVSRTLDRRFPF